MEILFCSVNIICLIILVPGGIDGMLVPGRHKLKIEPVGVKLCEQFCGQLIDCVSYHYNPYSLVCNIGSRYTNMEQEKRTITLNLTKPPVCRLNSGQTECTHMSAIHVTKSGRCICTKDRRMKEKLASIITSMPSSDLYSRKPLDIPCKCAFQMCGQNKINQARFCMKQLCLKGESEEREKYRRILTSSYMTLGKCNNTKSGKYRTILHDAAKYGFFNLVKCVLAEGIVSIDAKDSAGNTPTLLAVRKNHVATFNVLLKAGASLAIVKGDQNILHSACESAGTDIITAILDKGVDIERRSKAGLTPVMYAIKSKNLEVFKLLVKRGSDVSVTDNFGGTLLHRAAKIGADEIVRYILSENLVDKESMDGFGRTPVLAAAYAGNSQTFKTLNEYKCNLTVVDCMKNTLLHAACKSGNEEIVKKLLDLGFEEDLKKKNNHRKTPIELVKKSQGTLDQMLKQFMKTV